MYNIFIKREIALGKVGLSHPTGRFFVQFFKKKNKTFKTKNETKGLVEMERGFFCSELSPSQDKQQHMKFPTKKFESESKTNKHANYMAQKKKY